MTSSAEYTNTQGRGQIAVFNRSHYEDILIVRVHRLTPEIVRRKRYDHINDFERMLTDEGTTSWQEGCRKPQSYIAELTNGKREVQRDWVQVVQLKPQDKRT